MLDWKMDWQNGIWIGICNELWNLHFSQQYPTLLCIHLLTNQLIASSALQWPVHGTSSKLQGSKVMCIFNKLQQTHSIPLIHSQLAALPAIKETFEKCDRVEKGQKKLEHGVKWPRLLYTKFHSLFHVFQSSDQRYPCAKQLIIFAKCGKIQKFRTFERSLLLVFQAPLSKHRSGSRLVCQTCSTAHETDCAGQLAQVTSLTLTHSW